jgi:S1-C subfamily serine protease
VVRLDVERGDEAPRTRHRLRLFADEPTECAPFFALFALSLRSSFLPALTLTLLPRRPPGGRERGQGSGFVIDGPRGHVLTNAHVVAGARRVRVTFTDGRTFEARVLGVDAVTDLALLALHTSPVSASSDDAADAAALRTDARIAAQLLPAAPLGDSRALEVGDWVVAVGNPFGLDNSVTLGIVSALRRTAAEVGIPDKRLDFIQTDAAINPGNSGGPLVNEFGEVVGISTAIRADAEGIGFGIPINTAKRVVDRLAAGRPVQHPYLGIQVRERIHAGAGGPFFGVC